MAEHQKFDKTMRIGIDPATVDQQASAVPRGAIRVGRVWRTQSEKRDTPFYKLLESVYDAVLITTHAGRIIECNERACDFFLMESKALIGLDMVCLISGANEALIETINKNLKSKKFTLVEALCKRSDGTSFTAEIAINQMNLDTRGQLCFFVRDITIRRQAQQALEDAVERLQAHDRMRMEFVSNVSHELRTPLTSMIYAVNNMLRGVVGPLPEKALNYLDRLQSDCQRLLGTVNDILDLRQVENQTLVLTRSIVPLSQVTRDAAENLQVQADTKRIVINDALGDRELFSYCDAQKLERVLLNIIGNAIKFTPANGTITLTIEQNPQNLKHALITVSDTGMGIPPEILPKLAQRYFRVGDHVNGTGLGLAISREIVELHGGVMSFASPVPNTSSGTAVYVSLPLTHKPSILTLTQDLSASDLLKSSITSKGYACHLTDDSSEARAIIHAKPPAVLILDRCHTSADIRELFLQIRENPKTKRLPVIVLGHLELDRNEIQLYLYFGIHYITLPWRDKDLARSLAMAVLGKLR